jgi:hypothetical protein
MQQDVMVAIRWIFCLLFAGAAGCAHLPVTGTLPDKARVTEVTRVNAGAPFMLDPQGKLLAFGFGGLAIREIGSDEGRLVDAEEPAALAWASDGTRLAASFPHGEESTIRLYDRQGGVQQEVRLAGRVTSLAWRSAKEILAFAIQRQAFRFGGRMAEILYRWDGMSKPTATHLFDTTVMPATLRKWGDVLERPLTFTLSPLNDEILYARLRDPPVYSPYLQIILRNLESGTDREVANVSLRSAGGVFSSDGERMIYGDGESESRVLDPWGNRLIAILPSSGEAIALSPSGRFLLLDGHLYRDGKEIAAFPAASVGTFSADGEKLMVRYGEHLYLISGLSEELPAPADPEAAGMLRQLRKWLSEGLINAKEYQSTRERMLK